jgi:hypothetical protein
MFSSAYLDTQALIERDDWTSWWAILPATLRELQGIEHPLSSARQRANRIALWELRGGRSAESAYQAVRHCARCFHKEMPGHDMPTVPPTEKQRDGLHHWLWTTPGTSAHFRVLGACGFRLHTDDSSTTPFVTLEWCWLHPYSRRRGLFSEGWRIFLRRYGRIAVATPLPLAMRIFLHGRPVTTLEMRNGEPLRVYTETPECGQHGPMVQVSASAWACRVKLADGDPCKVQWHAPGASP